MTGSAVHLVLRVRLPDRPGALGAVASRIGALGADITDVTVAGRGSGSALDVFHLSLPDAGPDLDLMALLRDELAEVDGVRIESWQTASCCGVGALAPPSQNGEGEGGRVRT